MASCTTSSFHGERNGFADVAKWHLGASLLVENKQLCPGKLAGSGGWKLSEFVRLPLGNWSLVNLAARSASLQAEIQIISVLDRQPFPPSMPHYMARTLTRAPYKLGGWCRSYRRAVTVCAAPPCIPRLWPALEVTAGRCRNSLRGCWKGREWTVRRVRDDGLRWCVRGWLKFDVKKPFQRLGLAKQIDWGSCDSSAREDF